MERECPYGAEDCPKLDVLVEIEHDMKEQRETLITLVANFKVFAYIVVALITALTGWEVLI